MVNVWFWRRERDSNPRLVGCSHLAFLLPTPPLTRLVYLFRCLTVQSAAWVAHQLSGLIKALNPWLTTSPTNS